MEKLRNDARIVLTIDMDDIENAIDVQNLNWFYDKHPKVKQDALDTAFSRITKYVDKNFTYGMILEAVLDVARIRELEMEE